MYKINGFSKWCWDKLNWNAFYQICNCLTNNSNVMSWVLDLQFGRREKKKKKAKMKDLQAPGGPHLNKQLLQLKKTTKFTANFVTCLLTKMNSVCSTAPVKYLELEPEQKQLQELAAIPRTSLNGYMKFEQFKNDKSGHKTHSWMKSS